MATLRIRATSREGGASADRGKAFEAVDEATGEVLATGRFDRRATLDPITILASDGTPWDVRPARRVMPTRWLVSAEGRGMLTFDGAFLPALVNPLHRTSLLVLDAADRELFRVRDERRGVLDRLFSSGPRSWSCVRDDVIVGELRALSRAPRGDAGKLRRFLQTLAGFDFGVVSATDAPLLPAPAALGLALIHAELTTPV